MEFPVGLTCNAATMQDYAGHLSQSFFITLLRLRPGISPTVFTHLHKLPQVEVVRFEALPKYAMTDLHMTVDKCSSLLVMNIGWEIRVITH